MKVMDFNRDFQTIKGSPTSGAFVGACVGQLTLARCGWSSRYLETQHTLERFATQKKIVCVLPVAVLQCYEGFFDRTCHHPDETDAGLRLQDSTSRARLSGRHRARSPLARAALRVLS
jgi:hypothetical protein